MKKTITTEIDIDITSEDIEQYLKQADPLRRLGILRATITGFPQEDLKKAKKVIPDAIDDLIQQLQDFQKRYNSI